MGRAAALFDRGPMAGGGPGEAFAPASQGALPRAGIAYNQSRVSALEMPVPLLMTVLMCVALVWWIGSAGQRKRTRQRASREIEATLTTGLPTTETAVGRKAREVAEAQGAKLTNPPPIHGTARWAKASDAPALIEGNLLGVTEGRGLILGTLVEDDKDTGLPIVVRYPGHILTVAGTGQGKSATQLVANLLTYSGSVVVLDPKGELFELTAERRRQLGRVYRLAPLATEEEAPSDHYNPMDELKAEPREFGARARRLAEMLIVRQSDKGAAEAGFWENQASNLLTALIMAVVEFSELTGRPETCNLSEVRRITALPLLGDRKERNPRVREYFEDALLTMAQVSKNTFVQRQCAGFACAEPKQVSGYLAEINANLAFFDGHPGFEEVTSTSDFRLADLANEPITIYLTIPFKETSTCFRYLRAMVGLAFAALKEQREAKEASVLFILDEFAALRDMEFMRDAVAQMRSSGAWFWFLVQDLSQLEGIYKDWAGIFLSQTDHQIFFGATVDQSTKKYISSALGVGTFAYRDAKLSWSQSVGLSDSVQENPTQIGGGSGRNIGQSLNVDEPVQLAARPLLTPFEVGTYLSLREASETHPSTTIIFSKQASGYPLKVKRRHWRQMLSLVLPPSAPVTNPQPKANVA